ncbi:Gfo/Idh/MocA family oxidoreductase [Flavobacteriaceae bacterium]|nr:Gfo/Idh/MocA family oxidoreductase [Flavobacteriaceae bacterium]
MKILIIGLGSIARKHIDSLKKLSYRFEIFALRSNTNSKIENDVKNIYNIDEISFSINFAIISNPSNLHFKYIEILAKKNIPLFIEKPPLHSLLNSKKLVDLIEEKNLINYVAFNLRFHPCILFVKENILDQQLIVNELNVYCGSYLPEWRPQQDYRKSYSSNPLMGGGVHLDLIHEIDYITWLFGFPEKSNGIFKNFSSLKINSIDYANYILEYKSFTASIILNYYRKKVKREFEIITDKEIYTVDLVKNRVVNISGDCLFEAKSFEINDTYTHQLDYFINCLKTNTNTMNTLKSSLRNLKISLNE